MNRWISVAAGLIIAGAIVFLLLIGPSHSSVDHLRERFLSYGPWAVAASAALMVAQALIAPLPANVITITNGLVFGPLWGSLLSWSTMLAGASLCFLLSRILGRAFAAKLAGRSAQSAERFFKEYGLQAVFVARILPFVPFDAVSYGAGLVGVPYSRFVLATGIGIIPSTVVYSYLGSMIAGIYWWVLLGLLSLSFIAIVLSMKFFRKRQPRMTMAPSAPGAD